MAKKKSRTQPIEHAEIVRRFALRLRELRNSRGLTQADLGHKAHVTASYIWRLESAGAAPGIDIVDRLAAALGTTAADLLPSTEQPDPLPALKDQARKMFETLFDTADRETLLLLNPFLARLLESPSRRR
jgi:transcriptional regulator with XRE-family HTH domain